MNPSLYRPFRAWLLFLRCIPRALPWAVLLRPVEAEEALQRPMWKSIPHSRDKTLAPPPAFHNDSHVTRLSPEQFAIVTQEVASMLSENEHDEAWRVLKMFADGRFNLGPTDFPKDVQSSFAALGLER